MVQPAAQQTRNMRVHAELLPKFLNERRYLSLLRFLGKCGQVSIATEPIEPPPLSQKAPLQASDTSDQTAMPVAT